MTKYTKDKKLMICFRSNEEFRTKLRNLTKRTGINKSDLIRSVFGFFDEHFLKLLIVLEEIKENE